MNSSSLIYPTIVLHPLCWVPFSVHVFIAWWEQSQHSRADRGFARLQPTARLHQVSSRGKVTQVDKRSTFQMNRDCSWNWPLQEKWAHNKTYEKIPGIAWLSGKPGGERHLGECPSLCTWGGTSSFRAPVIYDYSPLMSPCRSLTSLHFLACDLTLYTFAYQGFL